MKKSVRHKKFCDSLTRELIGDAEDLQMQMTLRKSKLEYVNLS